MLAVIILAITPDNATPMAKEAVSKASEAAYIQTGMRDNFETAKKGLEGQAKKYVKTYGAEKPLAVTLGAAQIYKSRTVSFRVSRASSVTLREDSVSFTTSF